MATVAGGVLAAYIGFLGGNGINQNELSNFKIIWQPDDFACVVTQQ